MASSSLLGVFLGQLVGSFDFIARLFVNILGNALSYARIAYGMTFSNSVSLWWEHTQEEPGSVLHVHVKQGSL